MATTILLTGGTGYIGSHTAVELLNEGYEIICVDNCYNSSPDVLDRIEKITSKKVHFYHDDILDAAALKRIFSENKVDAVIHFAGLKAVGESVSIPLQYYHNNISGSLVLCQAMKDANVKNIVFSSSATVYGLPKTLPIQENFPLSATNPYGQTKLMIEQILQDLYVSDPGWSISILRYFNPVGAHKSGLIGEAPKGIPNNLMPYVTQVATGKLPKLKIFGNDYPTPDGTGVRDYIHVSDLALGHSAALKRVLRQTGIDVYNLGTGKGSSVLELLHAFEKASGRKIPYEFVGRRSGDIATCYADPTKAKKELHWETTRDLNEMCEDAWRWQSQASCETSD
ncbi:MAG TPA: UDP-glucose 4-epimerase GalE [Verrucomicrobiota bacterium]|nr:UDP-glucose 4-epimerase GalE [Verrucomicrobiota bacterium]